jgi:hypothetical protein
VPGASVPAFEQRASCRAAPPVTSPGFAQNADETGPSFARGAQLRDSGPGVPEEKPASNRSRGDVPVISMTCRFVDSNF